MKALYLLQSKYLVSIREVLLFSEDVFIIVKIREFKGVKLILGYTMKNAEGSVVAECESVHCFISKEGKPIRLAKEFPEFNKAITDNIED